MPEVKAEGPITIYKDITNRLGYEVSDGDDFKHEILAAINAALGLIMQLGVGSTEGTFIDDTNTWEEILKDRVDLELAKLLVYYDTKLTFDPPTTGPRYQSMERRRDELVFRVNVQAETPAKEVTK